MRGKRAPKRKVAADPRYESVAVAKFVNYIMRCGKKTVARKVVYNAFELMREKGNDPMEIFDAALKNVGPALEVRARRVGGANYQIPFPVSPERRQTLAMRWIIGATKSRKGKPMSIKLMEELLDAAKGEGAAMKKRTDVQKMAEANRAFAHFARYG